MRVLLANFSESPENFHLEQAFIRRFNAAGDGSLDVVHHFVNSSYSFLEPAPNQTGFRLRCPPGGDPCGLVPASCYEAAVFIDYPLRRPAFAQFLRLSASSKARRKVMILNHLLPTPEQHPSARIAAGRFLGGMDLVYPFEFETPERLLEIGARPGRLRPRRYAIDCVYYAPVKAPEERACFSAGSAGRDYELLVEASRGLGVELRLFTDTPGPALREAAAKRGEGVRVEGFCRNLERLRSEIACAAVVAVPIRPEFANDTAGLAVAFMGMAMAKPVVARDTPYLRRYIRDGQNGLLYRAGDRGDLRRKIGSLLAEPALRRAMGRRARRTVLAEASLDDFAARVCADLGALRGGAG